MNINKHIIENIEFYLNLDTPEYAFLLSGGWGSGKTYFIESFIEGYKNPNINIIKISLFGLKSTSDIDVKIFQALHPILGSKHARLAGNVIKGAISLGFKIDLNSDGKADSTVNSKFDKFDISEYFSDKDKNNKELVIVLDDLERTGISMSEILGYINYLVEISKIRVILVANEKFILDGKDKDIYEQFKEKVVGKTFEVKHNFDEVLASFLSSTKDKKLLGSCHIIKDVYFKSDCNNLRKIKQSIFDFEYLSSGIDKKFLNNQDFYSSLVRIFFALNIEIKKGVLNEDSLRKNLPFIKKINPDNEIEKISQKYLFGDNYLYNGNLWSDILFKGDLEKVNIETSNLIFFIDKQTKELPVWVRLLNFRELENEEFRRLIKEIESDIQNLNEDNLPIYLHKLALIIYFCKNELSSIGINNIKNAAKSYITKYESSDHWKNHLTQLSPFGNGTGYGYFNQEDSDFVEISSLIFQKNKEVYERERQQEVINTSNALITSIEQGQMDSFITILLRDYEYKPILNNIDSKLFVKVLLNSKNSIISQINSVIYARYLENKFLNSLPCYHYLIDEISFWQEVGQELEQKIEQVDGLKKHILKLFFEHTVSRIIALRSTENGNT